MDGEEDGLNFPGQLGPKGAGEGVDFVDRVAAQSQGGGDGGAGSERDLAFGGRAAEQYSQGEGRDGHAGVREMVKGVVDLVFADDFYFGFEFDAPGLAHPGLDQINEVKHVGRGGAAEVHEEIRMDVADHRVADPGAFQSEFIDQSTRRGLGGRILEGAAGTRLSRLGAPAFGVGGGHTFLDDGPFGWDALKHGPEGEVSLEQGTPAVLGASVGPGNFPNLTASIHGTDRVDDVKDPVSHCTGIHAQRASHISRDAFEEFQTGKACLSCRIGESLQRGAGAGADPVFWQNFHLGKRRGLQRHDQTADTAIADKEI
jgi:hypothetical protein